MIWLISASGRIGSWFRYKVKSLENTSNTNRFIIFKNYTVNRHLSTRNNSNLSARAHSQGDNSYHCWAFSRVSCTTMIRHSWILFLQKTRHFFSAVFLQFRPQLLLHQINLFNEVMILTMKIHYHRHFPSDLFRRPQFRVYTTWLRSMKKDYLRSVFGTHNLMGGDAFMYSTKDPRPCPSSSWSWMGNPV